MHFQSLIGGFFSLASLTLGFDLPDNAPYGEYLIPISSNGTQTGEAIFVKAIDASVTSALKEAVTPRGILPYSSINCSWRPITPGAYSLVQEEVGTWCDAGGLVPANFAWYWYGYSAEAYMCNYSGNAQGCSSAEYDEALSLISGVCGANVAGWVGINNWAKSYGIDDNGVSQCW